MATHQILVRLLDGQTRCIQIENPRITGSSLKNLIRERTGIPVPFQRLVAGALEISETSLLSSINGLFPSCTLLLRLRGGKGGFGSLLRGAATKAGQKKTNNFDACRDMSGRRLRHVNAEKKLEEWKAEEEERRLEKVAEEFLKKQSNSLKKKNGKDVDNYLEKYREETAKSMEEVDEAVKASIDLCKGGKRKVLHELEAGSKKLKLWMLEEEEEDDDEDDMDGKSVVVDEGCSTQREAFNKEECASHDISVSGMRSTSGASCSSSYRSLKNDSSDSDLTENDSLNSLEVISEETEENSAKGIDECHELSLSGSVVAEGCLVGEINAHREDKFEEALEGNKENACDFEEALEGNKENVCNGSTSARGSEMPLNFDNFNAPPDIEVLGLERLKLELQARGLKCGGTLQERAARLFLLKTTPFDKLPKKLLAKPKD
ncbi:protein SDE2 homolog [Amborella trichopoda]|uniref:Uncharacterized protein n=1 Tax=Amborella trichopoda TaxID=13333 RepID=W1PMR0_AMBTC|nr:protein SDE2 homolog [Amborella trichopoda]ERN09338.1 hypothetical protein AMTR_s00162p00029070 [Amborella trichopoda]|eukprot:XP_006847757.1 protein SDE2 homolog [Amborella trichopoda]